MTILKVDTSNLIRYTNQLEKMRKYDFPLAVRGTLNKAAFDVKGRTMPASAEDTFTIRKQTFFKANSKVVPATGFNIHSMESTVGFISNKLQYNNKAVRELAQQEKGGKIPDRDYVPLDEARIDDSDSKMVEAKNRVKRFKQKKIIFASKMQGGSRKQKFIRAAHKAGKGNYVVSGFNKQILRRINSVKLERNNPVVKSTPLYEYQDGRAVRIKATGFMRRASLRSANRLEHFYIQEAKRRFESYMKRK